MQSNTLSLYNFKPQKIILMCIQMKNGYYTLPYTQNDTVAVINGKAFRVAMCQSKYTGELKRSITRERIFTSDEILAKCKYEPFQK